MKKIYFFIICGIIILATLITKVLCSILLSPVELANPWISVSSLFRQPVGKPISWNFLPGSVIHNNLLISDGTFNNHITSNQDSLVSDSVEIEFFSKKKGSAYIFSLMKGDKVLGAVINSDCSVNKVIRDNKNFERHFNKVKINNCLKIINVRIEKNNKSLVYLINGNSLEINLDKFWSNQKLNISFSNKYKDWQNKIFIRSINWYYKGNLVRADNFKSTFSFKLYVLTTFILALTILLLIKVNLNIDRICLFIFTVNLLFLTIIIIDKKTLVFSNSISKIFYSNFRFSPHEKKYIFKKIIYSYYPNITIQQLYKYYISKNSSILNFLGGRVELGYHPINKIRYFYKVNKKNEINYKFLKTINDTPQLQSDSTIYLLGGSQTFGEGALDTQNSSSFHLSKYLLNANKFKAFLNIAQPGATLEDQLQILKESQTTPSAILLIWGANETSVTSASRSFNDLIRYSQKNNIKLNLVVEPRNLMDLKNIRNNKVQAEIRAKCLDIASQYNLNIYNPEAQLNKKNKINNLWVDSVHLTSAGQEKLSFLIIENLLKN